MKNIERLSSVSQFNSKRGQETLHPLVSILDQTKSKPITANRYLTDIYVIFLKDFRCEDFQYGRNKYDYQEETLLFIGPGQVFGFDLPNEVMIQPSGWALVFHPDLIKGTSLGKKMNEYSFFSYENTEALHISERERQIVLDCFKKIKEELERNIDKHSRNLIISNIELFLNYCVRFYERQFVTRETINKDILVQFEHILQTYFESELPSSNGIPTVNYCAEALHLSPNYFGDLIKKETGKTALDFIQSKIIDLAKERIFDKKSQSVKLLTRWDISIRNILLVCLNKK